MAGRFQFPTADAVRSLAGHIGEKTSAATAGT